MSNVFKCDSGISIPIVFLLILGLYGLLPILDNQIYPIIYNRATVYKVINADFIIATSDGSNKLCLTDIPVRPMDSVLIVLDSNKYFNWVVERKISKRKK